MVKQLVSESSSSILTSVVYEECCSVAHDTLRCVTAHVKMVSTLVLLAPGRLG